MVCQVARTSVQHDVETLQTIDTAALEIVVNKSATAHPHAGISLFASQTIRKCKGAEQYYGFLVYTNFTKEWHKMETYGKCVIKVTAETYRNWANELLGTIADKYEVEYKV